MRIWYGLTWPKYFLFWSYVAKLLVLLASKLKEGYACILFETKESSRNVQLAFSFPWIFHDVLTSLMHELNFFFLYFFKTSYSTSLDPFIFVTLILFPADHTCCWSSSWYRAWACFGISWRGVKKTIKERLNHIYAYIYKMVFKGSSYFCFLTSQILWK